MNIHVHYGKAYCRTAPKIQNHLNFYIKPVSNVKASVHVKNKEFLHHWANFIQWPEHLEESLPTGQSAGVRERKEGA